MSSTITPPRTGDGGREASGAKPAKPAEVETEAGKSKLGGRRKKLIALVALLAVAGGGYLTLGRGHGAGPAQPGTVLKLDPLTLNLDGGHYLKLALALQFTKAASGGAATGNALDGSKALDLAISQLSNRRVSELNATATREKAKADLLAAVVTAYHHDVMDLYFTEFVMQ
jgi:flagellar FliL protein